MSLIDDFKSADDWRQVLRDKDVTYLKSEILQIGRWSHRTRLVIHVDGKYYAIETDEPNTEYQEDDIDEEPSFYEVTPVRKTITAYAPVAKAYDEV